MEAYTRPHRGRRSSYLIVSSSVYRIIMCIVMLLPNLVCPSSISPCALLMPLRLWSFRIYLELNKIYNHQKGAGNIKQAMLLHSFPQSTIYPSKFIEVLLGIWLTGGAPAGGASGCREA